MWTRFFFTSPYPPKWNSLSGVHTHTQEEEIQQRRSTSQRKKEKKKTRRVKANIHKRLATLMRGNVNAKMLYTSLIIKCVSCSQHTHTTYHLSLEKKKCVLNNIQPKSLPLVPPIHSDVFWDVTCMRERERGKIRIGLVKAKSVITARHALRLSQTNSDASTSFVTTYEFSIEGGGG